MTSAIAISGASIELEQVFRFLKKNIQLKEACQITHLRELCISPECKEQAHLNQQLSSNLTPAYFFSA
jgi:hypothetical protein